MFNRYTGYIRNGILDHFNAFLGGEQRRLCGVCGDSDNKSVKQINRALNYIQVSVGDGVKGAGIDRELSDIRHFDRKKVGCRLAFLVIARYIFLRRFLNSFCHYVP